VSKRNVEFEAISKTHGQLKYLPKLTWAARVNRNHQTTAEIIIWEKILRRKQTGHKFVRQKPIDRFIIDFYCSELCLAIEIDGESHKSKKEYDSERDLYLKQIGIETLRFSNDEAINNIDTVKQQIYEYISLSALSREGGRAE
jgi:very-short-patch-repair endonuclease